MSQFTADQLIQMSVPQPAPQMMGQADLIPAAARLPALAPQSSQTQVAQPQAAQSSAVGAYSAQDLAHMQAGINAPVYAIDYSQPIARVRAAIARLPESMREDALRIWANTYVQQERQSSTGVDDRIRALSRGTLIGSFLDEANAATQAALHAVSGGYAGAPYDETLAYNRARDRSFDRSNPIESAGLQIAGGVASAVPILRAPATVSQAVGRGIAYGAGAGAVHGFGNGEGGFGNRVDSALGGAGMGALFGAGFPLAGAALSRGVGSVRDAVTPTIARWRGGPDAAAETILAQRMASGGTTPQAIAAELAAGERNATMRSNSLAPLPETIADTTDSMRRLTGSLYRTGGEAGDFVRGAIEGRQRGPLNPYAPTATDQPGQMGNIINTLERALGVRSNGTARQTEASIQADMRRRGNELYDQARRQSEEFNIQGVLDSFSMQMAQYPAPFASRMQRALNLFTEANPRGARFPVSTIERFDNAKKALDDMIERGQRGGDGNLVRLLTQFKNDLFSAVHAPDAAGNPTRNIGYAHARSFWGDRQSDLAALDLGRNALREASDVTAEAFRALTERQRALFRIGLADSARQALGSRRSGDDATRLFSQARVQELLAEAIPASRGRGVFSDRPARFGDLMQRQARMVQTRNEVLGNSKTAQRVQDDLEFAGNTLSQMYNRFRSSPSLFNLGVEAVSSAMQRVFAFRQDVALAMARRLLTQDREEQRRVLAAVQARSRDREGLTRFAELLDRMSIATAMSAPAPATGGR